MNGATLALPPLSDAAAARAHAFTLASARPHPFGSHWPSETLGSCAHWLLHCPSSFTRVSESSGGESECVRACCRAGEMRQNFFSSFIGDPRCEHPQDLFFSFPPGRMHARTHVRTTLLYPSRFSASLNGRRRRRWDDENLLFPSRFFFFAP